MQPRLILDPQAVYVGMLRNLRRDEIAHNSPWCVVVEEKWRRNEGERALFLRLFMLVMLRWRA